MAGASRRRRSRTPRTSTTIGRAIDRWATLTEAYQKQPELHNALLNMFVRAYDVIDRGYWPAHVAAAEYFLSHDNDGQGRARSSSAALKANPNDVARAAAARADRAGRVQLRRRRQRDRRDPQGRPELDRRRPAGGAEPAPAAPPEGRRSAARARAGDAAARTSKRWACSPATYALQLQDDKTAEMLAARREARPGQRDGVPRSRRAARRDAAVPARGGDVQGRDRARPVVDRRAQRPGPALHAERRRGRRPQPCSTRPTSSTRSTSRRPTTSACSTTWRSSRRRRPSTSSSSTTPKHDPIIPEYFGEYLESDPRRGLRRRSSTSRR